MKQSAVHNRNRTIELTLQGHRADSVAKELNISARQVRNILATPAVKAELRTLERERMRTIVRRAGTLGEMAIVRLGEIAREKGEPASAQVAACRSILDVLIRVNVLADISERLTDIERSVERLLDNETPIHAIDGERTWRKIG